MLVWVSLYEFDKFKFKTWKTIEPGKSHVGVSESFWIWRIQIQDLKILRSWEIDYTPVDLFCEESLYRSESPSQVAIFVIAFFCLLLKEIPEHMRNSKRYFFAYDNVCNLANMKLWREPLPIRSFPNLWKDNLIKIIDSLHLHNHKRSSCHVNFNPNVLKKELPNANTMICEQTFTWLGRFKKILNSLPKHRFDFMLHRLIIHRNRYTEYCHSVNKYPLLPSVKPTKKT